MKLAIVANSAWYVYNFRRNLMTALRAAGHEVVVMAAPDDYGARLQAEGWTFQSIPFTGAGTHPVEELRTVASLRRAFSDTGIDTVLSYTPKGNVYAALAAVGRRIALLPNISGLGRAFVSDGWLARIARLLYRFNLRRARVVFFQNPDDRAQFVSAGIVDPAKCRLVPGSGVDLARFTATPSTGRAPALRFLMVARLIWEKGVQEFAKAAQAVRRDFPDCRFALLGPVDASRNGVPLEALQQWHREGVLEYLGATDDVRPHLEASDCVVLPSFYREGIPRSLLEGAAMARPLITTDAPGCRECVAPSVNGFLVPLRDAEALAEAMRRIVALPDDERLAMGAASRARIERDFSEQRVIAAYLEVLKDMPAA